MKNKIAAIALASTLALTLSAKTPLPTSERAARDTFSDVKLLTAQAQDQAEKLFSSIASANLAPAFARERLQSLRYELNAIGQSVDQLIAAKQLLPSAEQNALDKAIPALQDAANKTQAAILSYNESAHASWFMKNCELAKSIQQDTQRAHNILAKAQKFESTVEHENRAAAKLNQSLQN